MAKNSFTNLIIDTVLVLSGFAIAIVAAAELLVKNDLASLLLFLLGFIIVSYAMGRRMKASWY